MTIIKRAELDMIGFDVGNDPVKQGQIALRWRKLTYDGDRLVATEYHRTVIDADTDLNVTLADISQDLEQQGFAPPPATDRPYIDAVSDLAWTPEVRAAVAASRAAEQEARRKEAEAAAAAQAKDKEAEEARFAAWAAKQGLIARVP